eukprot:COSAG06_NODE_19621_length_830_cov_1.797538_1_plen_127_part_10
MDASCRLMSAAGQKMTSSANFPPELARYELAKQNLEDMSLLGYYSSTAEHCEVDLSEWYSKAWQPTPPKATCALEIYYFGLLAFSLCTPDAETVFKANQADNLVNWEVDSERLAYRMEEMKLELTAR